MKLVIVIGVVVVLYFIYESVVHELVIKINQRTMSKILKKGLFHYTTFERAKKILESQTIYATADRKSIFRSKRDRSTVWFLLNSADPVCNFFRKRVICRHCPINPTGKRRSVRYETKLLVTGFDYQDMRRMRSNLEMSIGVYCDKLEKQKIKPAPLDKIDIDLGIREIVNVWIE